MPNDRAPDASTPPDDAPQALAQASGRDLSPAARRALSEAAERRERERGQRDDTRPPEIDGRNGPEPTRFGDWERNGIISDF